MTKIIGLTGGIASGKTTVSKFLKKNKYAVHESDTIVKKLYKNPSQRFITFLKKNNFSKSIKGRKIDKSIIRDEIFNNQTKKRKLESFIHKQVKVSRNDFLKKQKRKKNKIIILDIPLLFEAKLENICDYIVLLYSPQKTRVARALKRPKMTKNILQKILKNQLSDKYKKKKSNFVINTSKTKNQTFKMILKTFSIIIKENA